VPIRQWPRQKWRRCLHCVSFRGIVGRAAFVFFSPSQTGALQTWDKTMAKPATVKIRLVSTADTGFFYVTKKNPRNITEKMSFRKYDPVARKHVEFKEAKIK